MQEYSPFLNNFKLVKYVWLNKNGSETTQNPDDLQQTRGQPIFSLNIFEVLYSLDEKKKTLIASKYLR